MSAAAIARALGGRRTGNTWMARCPVHDDRTPSLAIRDGRDGRVLLHCHAGCRQDEVLAAVATLGLSVDEEHVELASVVTKKKIYDKTEDKTDGGDDTRRTEAALSVWRQTSAAAGTPVEAYLRSRGIAVAVPDRLRFHPRLKHPDGSAWPGMVALVTRGTDDVPVAVHRTFLQRDGRGKAPVVPQKMMLGPCRGGAVRLGGAGDRLLVGEGIETVLSVLQATGRRSWAALSTSGLRVLDLPETIAEITVVADNDTAGENAARSAAARWRREGRHVRIARPADGCKDFNDMLLRSAHDGRASA